MPHRVPVPQPLSVVRVLRRLRPDLWQCFPLLPDSRHGGPVYSHVAAHVTGQRRLFPSRRMVRLFNRIPSTIMLYCSIRSVGRSAPALATATALPGAVLLILFCLLMFLAAPALPAQDEDPAPCTPDCPDSVWRGPFVITLPAPAPFQQCKVTVKYFERTACAAKYNDVQIQTVEIPFNSSCQGFINWLVDPANHNQNFAGNYITRLHNIFGVALVDAKFKAWYDDQGTPQIEKDRVRCREGYPGAARWRVVRGSCFYPHLDACNCQYVLRSCPNAICCLKQFRVCWDEAAGRPVITYDGSPNPMGQCPEPPAGATTGSITTPDGLCFQTCDDDGIDEGIAAAGAAAQEPGGGISRSESGGNRPSGERSHGAGRSGTAVHSGGSR